VRQYLEDKYGSDALQSGGWRVITTLDADLQVKAEEVVKRNALANTTKFNASNAALIALDPQNGQILSMVGSRNYFDTEIDGAYNVAVSAPAASQVRPSSRSPMQRHLSKATRPTRSCLMCRPNSRPHASRPMSPTTRRPATRPS
jgi:membrane carboxypeptidase/penicillin-binding protein